MTRSAPSPTPCLLATVALIAGSCAPLAWADDSAPHTAPPMRQLRAALQRDLGLDAGRLARRLDIEQRFTHAQHDARRRLGAAFAGAWIEQGPDGEARAVIATTRRVPDARTDGFGADVRVATYSLDALDSALSRLGRPQRPPVRRVGATIDPAIRSWFVDVPRNRIVVRIAPGVDALAKARAFIADAAVDPRMVRFTVTDARPTPAAVALRGGDAYQSGLTGCTVGFPVSVQHYHGFLTAGHCGRQNTPVWGWTGDAIGLVQASTYPGADHAWVRRTSDQWYEYTRVRTDSGDMDIVGNHEGPVGGVVCRTGAATQYRCGTLKAKNVSVNYDAGVVSGLTSTSACSAPGDSGGPHFGVSPGWAGVEAQGIHSGNNTSRADHNGCLELFPGDQESYFQPVIPALMANGLTLMTAKRCGRLNAGGYLTVGASIFSCNGRYQLVQQGDGNLVLYKVGGGPLWWSDKYGGNFVTVMQGDGNLVTYDAANRAQWDTKTYNHHGAALFVLDSGNMMVYSAQGQVLWQSNTAGG